LGSIILISKGVNPKIPPTPLFDDKFIRKLKKERSNKARAEELKYAIVEHIGKHFEEDPEFYERFSDLLKRILEEYRDNWDALVIELEKLREAMKKGREAEKTFGFDPKKEMPFFGLLKQEIYGKKPVETLSNEDIELLVNLTRDVIEIIKREIQMVDFWESYPKQKRLKSYIVSNILLPRSTGKKVLFGKRNEIAQKLMELAYHIYGE